MARVKFSALVSEMRNKLNGSVFSKNRAGNYLRNKVTPVNPRSVAQVNFRQTFGSVSSAYRGLNVANIQSWVDGSPNFPYTDIFGDTKFLSASQLHQKLNTNLASVGLPLLQTCPYPRPLSDIVFTSAAVAIGASTITLTMSAGAPSSTSFWIIEATPPVPRSINFVKNRYRRVLSFTDTALPVTPAMLYNAYVATFGLPALGRKIYFRVSIIDGTTGQSNIGVVQLATIAP